MDTSELKDMTAQERIEPKNAYETPRVTTFGSVAKLTLLHKTGSHPDFFFGRRHGNEPYVKQQPHSGL